MKDCVFYVKAEQTIKELSENTSQKIVWSTTHDFIIFRNPDNDDDARLKSGLHKYLFYALSCLVQMPRTILHSVIDSFTLKQINKFRANK